MSDEKRREKSPKKRALPHPPLKPGHRHTEGAPDDRDSNAQYEDKDES